MLIGVSRWAPVPVKSTMAEAAYTAPGMTVPEVESAVGVGLGYSATDIGDSTILAKIDQAITAAALACATWDGTDWWWLHSSGSFPTVADTPSYVLRTVNTANMPALWAVDRIYYDDERELSQISWLQYQNWYRLLRPSANTASPLEWAVTGEPPTLYLSPTPDDAYTIYVDYTLRHSKITKAGSSTAALIVPAEYQWGIYVGGAEWLIRHETFEPMSLHDCPQFMEAIGRMKASNPIMRGANRDLDKFSDSVGTIPWDQSVYVTDGGSVLLTNKPVIT